MATRPVLEWVCAALGGLLTAATLTVVALQIPGSDDAAAPDLRVEVTGVVPAASGALVRITVSNAARRTAAGVEVEGRLEEAGRVVETSRATFNYVPSGSAARGGLWFTRDPARYTLLVRAVGYSEP